MMKFYYPHALALFVAISPALAQAQVTPPDAGQSIRELENPPGQLPASPGLELQLPDVDDAAPRTGGATLAVSGFRITGNTLIPEAELLGLLADLPGTLSLGELEAAAQRLSDYYRAQGYLLARAYLPAQDIAEGIVEIAVLEGQYGELQVDDQVGLKASVLAPLTALEPGQPVRAESLERSLLLLADTPGVEVDSTLRPGASVGTSDLVVRVRPGQRLNGAVDLDSYGSRFTGAWRLGGTLNLNNPLYLGDAASLRLMTSDGGQRYLRTGYEVPLGPWSTRLGAAYSYMRYELGEDFADLDAEGSARIASLYASQPLVRSRIFNLSAALQYDDKRLKDEIGAFATRNDKHSSVWIASLTGNSRDAVGGGGINSFSFSYTQGDLAIGSPFERVQDALTARTQGDFSRVNLSLLRLQQLPGRFSLTARLQGQWSGDNLDSSEQFSLGGAYGVRAYPQGEATGDRGWLTNLSLAYALTPQWQTDVFVDYGKIARSAKPWAPGDNDLDLEGIGASLRWVADGWQVSARAAWRLGSAPQSDRDREPRTWIQTARSF